jgi:hypothetical protein
VGDLPDASAIAVIPADSPENGVMTLPFVGLRPAKEQTSMTLDGVMVGDTRVVAPEDA